MAENAGKQALFEQGAAHAQRAGCESDPEFDEVAVAWPTLPDAVKAGVLAMVRSSHAD